MRFLAAWRDRVFADVGKAAWAGHGSGPMDVALAALFRREPGREPASRQLGLLAGAVARAGAVALGARPAETARRLAALSKMGAAPMLVAGDSHSRLWVHRSRRGGRWLLPLHHLATGASAAGLGRATSRSGEGPRLRALVQALGGAGLRLPVVLVFGQVDVEFVHTFKRLANDPPAAFDETGFEAFCQATAAGYADYAAGLAALGADVSLAAIFPPALSDAAWREGYLDAHIAHEHAALDVQTLAARLRTAEVPDLARRSGHHDRFNAVLQRAALERGLGWIDAALPTSGGSVSPELLGAAAGRDHHLDAWAVRPFTTAALWAAVDREATNHG